MKRNWWYKVREGFQSVYLWMAAVLAVGIFIALVLTGFIKAVQFRFWEYEVGRHFITLFVGIGLGLFLRLDD